MLGMVTTGLDTAGLVGVGPGATGADAIAAGPPVLIGAGLFEAMVCTKACNVAKTAMSSTY